MNKYANWEASEHSHHDPLALVTALIRDRDQISLTLDVAKADRDKWFNRAKVLDVDKADLLRVLGVADARVKALEAALTPSTETKAAYIGEVQTDGRSDDMVTVSWTATKEIMAMILAYSKAETGAKE